MSTPSHRGSTKSNGTNVTKVGRSKTAAVRVGKMRSKAAAGKKVKSSSENKIFTMKVRSASNALGSLSNLATYVGVDRSQPTRWATGETEPTTGVARAVTDLEFIIARAGMVWDETVIPDWLEGHNAFLDGATPLEMIRRGRTSEVLDAITGDESGVYA